jgi:hypothetical protein
MRYRGLIYVTIFTSYISGFSLITTPPNAGLNYLVNYPHMARHLPFNLCNSAKLIQGARIDGNTLHNFIYDVQYCFNLLHIFLEYTSSYIIPIFFVVLRSMGPFTLYGRILIT